MTALRPLALGCLALFTAAAAGCGARSSDAVPLVLSLDHRLGDAPLTIDSAHDAAGDTSLQGLGITRLSYYLGRFRVQRADGRWVGSRREETPEGDYVRIDLAQSSTLRFEPLRLPPGDYRALEFLIGVDAQRNAGGAQTGALDPAHGLFWTWKTGYIFFALEGRAPASGAPDGSLTYHLGGDAALGRTVVLPVRLHADADAANVPLTLRVELAEFFRGLDLHRTHTVMSAQDAAPLADRYAGLFSVSPQGGNLVATVGAR